MGEPLQYQVVVTSYAQPGSAAVKISKIRLVFEALFKTVEIQHSSRSLNPLPNTSERVQIQDVAFCETPSSEDSTPADQISSSLVGTADLIFVPGQVKAFTFTSTPKEPGIIRAVSCTLSVEDPSFHLDYIVPIEDGQLLARWWTRGKGGIEERRFNREQPASMKIMPRPPKILIQLADLRSEYYTGELVVINVDIINNEDEEVDAAIEMRLLGPGMGTPELTWGSRLVGRDQSASLSSSRELENQTTHLPRRTIGGILPAARTTETVSFRATTEPADYVLEIKTLYHLASKPDTPLSKTLASELVIVAPFEANYDFLPRLHPDPWPSFFRIEGDDNEGRLSSDLARSAAGVKQNWCLTARVVSFATESLHIETINASILGMYGEVAATITSTAPNGTLPSTIGPNEGKEFYLALEVQKLSLDDRRSGSLDLTVEVGWRRSHGPFNTNTALLSVPRLLVSGGEPRVLASLRQVAPGASSLIQVDYAFENPSLHFLTFNLTMEASESFAFSGPKSTSLQLVPLSRHTVHYNLLPYVTGTWIQPQLKVIDMYFNKQLHIGATEGMKSDKKGILVWVNTDDN